MNLNSCNCDGTAMKELITSLIENQQVDRHKCVTLHNHLFQEHVIAEEIHLVVRYISKSWMSIQNVLLYDSTVSYDELTCNRELINSSLKAVLNCVKYCEREKTKVDYMNLTVNELKRFSFLLLSLDELEHEIQFKLSQSIFSNERTPGYQFVHAWIEVHCYLLVIIYICKHNSEVVAQIDNLLKDLILLSRKFYKQHQNYSFTCECFKDLWLLIQVIAEKASQDNNFWGRFNNCLDNSDCAFNLFLLKNVSFIIHSTRDVKPNFYQIETSLQNILANGETNSLKATLQSIYPLVCDHWLKLSKIEIYQSLWEFYSKRLNFTLRNTVDISLAELINVVDTILWSPKECEHEFDLFIGMLIVHLNDHPHHWGKIKGRFYSQLHANKIKDLNDVGLFHVLLLFISITHVSFEEVVKKFIGLVDGFPVQKKQLPLVMRFYSLMIIRHFRENRSIENISLPLVRLLEEASSNHKSFHLIKEFTLDLDTIINESPNLHLQQWLLLDKWIYKYSQKCQYSDLESLLEVLLKILEKANSADMWCDWAKHFIEYVYPTLKLLCSGTNAPETVGTIAAKIAAFSPQLFEESLIFYNDDERPLKVTTSFLKETLKRAPLNLSSYQESMAIRTWIRACLLSKDDHSEITGNILKLDSIPNFLKIKLNNAGDPLCTLIDCLSNDIDEHLQNSQITKFCEICFDRVGIWVSQYFNGPQNEAAVLRIFTCVALACYKIGSLLYNRHKTHCPYVSLLNCIVLNADVLTGRPLHPSIIQAIGKTWQTFYLSAIKLNTIQDKFIDRVLKEMVVKYIPYFSVSQSPMLKCFDNEKVAEVFLEKLSAAFFKHPAKAAESAIHKSLRLIESHILANTSLSNLKLVVSKSLPGMLELVMFHSQKQSALGVIRNLTSSPLFPDVKSEFQEALVDVMEKHLAFSATNFFQMMLMLSKFISNDLIVFIPKIRKHISNVERMKGVGFDKGLRLQLERLEASLNSM